MLAINSNLEKSEDQPRGGRAINDEGMQGPQWDLSSFSSPTEEGKTQYLSIATSLQHLVGRVSGMRLVGKEVRALYLVDGLNLGKSCQVFVIKDLIIHFGLGRRQMGRKEVEE